MELSTANLKTLDRLNDPRPDNMATSVLVIGAGELGLSALTALSKHPKRSQARIGVLLRQATLDTAAPDKKKKLNLLESWGVHFEAADVEQASTEQLAGVLGRYHTVVSCTGMELPSGTQTKLVHAAVEGGVKRYFPWQFGMDYDLIGEGSSQDLFDEQLGVRKVLRGQDKMDWVIVSTGLFMSFLFVAAFGVVDLDEKVIRGLGSWDNKITVTTPEDIGRVTADLILHAGDVEKQVVFTAGDTVSYGKIADLVEARFGKDVFTRELWDRDALKKQMEEDATVLVKYRDTFAQGVGVAWDKDVTVNEKRGIRLTGLKEYLDKLPDL